MDRYDRGIPAGLSRRLRRRPMAPTWCAQSHPTNGRRLRSMRRSTTSLRAIVMPSTIRQSVAGSCSTPRPAAINATRSRRRSGTSPPLRTMIFTTFSSASSDTMSSHWRAKPSNSSTRATQGRSIKPPSQRTSRPLVAFLITKKEADLAAFKTPDIRNILVTGPYFHDGSQETLGMSSITTTRAMVCKTRISTKTFSRWP